MKVKATGIGFYGGRTRIKGEIFDIADEVAFSSFWMEWVDKIPEPGIPEEKPVEAPKTEVPKLRGNPAWRKKVD